MENRQAKAAYNLANRQLLSGNVDGAIDSLRNVMAEYPDFAPGHSLLAMCLLQKRRIHAADVEANIALTIDPERAMSLYAKALVLLAKRKLKEARQFLEQAIALEPTEASLYCTKAKLCEIERDYAQARTLLNQALELDPEEPDVLVQLGGIELKENKTEEAKRLAREALQIEPENVDGLVLMGEIHLRLGNVEDARQHALWALRINAEDPGAIHLLAGVKSKKSWLLGIWWHWNSWMSRHGENTQILILLGAYLFYRISKMAIGDAGHEQLSDLVSYVWLGLCIYTWFSPAIFRRSIERELQPVRLEKDF